MKVYISADIEGITGVTHWNETEDDKPDYAQFRQQMTAEVAAACEGALAAGAAEIWVKDAHGSGRNIIAEQLPRQARLLRGWTGHPLMMVERIDNTFQAAMMIGYHSPAGYSGNPLAHTISGKDAYILINGIYASEFMIYTYAAALHRVPVVFLSGDAALCQDAAALVPGLTSVAVKEGQGDSTLNLHPHLALEKIKDGAQRAVTGDVSRCRLELPAHFAVEVRYKNHAQAYSSSFFPGASLKDAHTIQFETNDYFEVLRFLIFVL
jgi:D-amino peptidase